ncbi:MAG: hypothetical protein CTY20_07710 [Hyphomicrobium sp.]|nr:MAG: hypothetical protein CTY20_07710 [Hyphomicrobium sp.]
MKQYSVCRESGQAVMLGLCFVFAGGCLPAFAQYPEVDRNDPGIQEPERTTPTPPQVPAFNPAAAPTGPAPPVPSAAQAAEVQLTEEEKAEREGRRACKAAICAAFHNRKAGDDVSCTVLKSFRKEQLDKMLSKAKASWPWGKVKCTADVKLKRDLLMRALIADKLEAKMDPHQVSCTIDREKEASSEIKFEFSPAVTFEKGKAVKAQANWGKIEAPNLVKGAMWPATATDNTFNVIGSTLIEDINDFIGKKCDEVKADWVGK